MLDLKFFVVALFVIGVAVIGSAFYGHIRPKQALYRLIPGAVLMTAACVISFNLNITDKLQGVYSLCAIVAWMLVIVGFEAHFNTLPRSRSKAEGGR